NEYRSQLEFRVREKLPKVESSENSSNSNSDADALKELKELKRKMAQMEQEKKITDERDRIVNEVRDKTTQYQMKLAELKSWYQLEMTKITMGTLGPEDKSKKITELTEEYSNSMNKLSEILN
ncbi:MAG: hypothetical protein K2Q18_04675, partial [Bdellovibrionales bacterium]|nr:hypothetical protein [Bdellovibrionales bacterium]